MSRLAAKLLLFLLVLGALCLAIWRPLNGQSLPQIREKMEAFRARKDSVNVLFVGSSLVNSHVSPRLFDEQLAARGIPVRSFNFGISDMTPLESFFLVRKLLRERPAALKYVVMEALQVRYSAKPGVAVTDKFIYWHDARTTWQTLEIAARAGIAPMQKARYAAEHFHAMGRNYLNLGLGRSWLGRRISHRKLASEENLGPGRDGYVSYDEYCRQGRDDVRELMLHFQGAGERARFQRDLEAFLRGREAAPWSMGAMELGLFAQLAEELNRQGVVLMFVIMPRLADQRGLLVLGQAPYGARVFDFGDPAVYPEFFTHEARADYLHLNEAMAERMTMRLADEFAGALRPEKAAVAAGKPAEREPTAGPVP